MIPTAISLDVWAIFIFYVWSAGLFWTLGCWCMSRILSRLFG